MTDPSTRGLLRALQPILSRVRTDVSAIKLSDGSRWTTEPLTEAAMERHLGPGPARGACPIKAGESTTRLAVFDLDSHGGQTDWPGMCEAALTLMSSLEEGGYQPVPWRSSGGRGIHIFVLWDEPQDAYSVRCAMIEALGRAGMKPGAKGVHAGQVEVFPKQDEVAPGEFGNQFILPLAGRSVPLDPLFGLEPMSREAVLGLDWPVSSPVPRRERPKRDDSESYAAADPIEKVRAALFAIKNDGSPGSPDYDEWFKLCCAVHEATGGSPSGREVFAAWSRQNPIFDEKFFEARVWRYLKGDGERSSAYRRDTLYWRASQEGWSDFAKPDTDGFDDVEDAVIVSQSEDDYDPFGEPSDGKVASTEVVTIEQKLEAKDRYKSMILEAPDERTLRGTVCATIASDSVLDSIERGMLAEVLKGKLAKFDAKASIADCRKMLSPSKKDKRNERRDWTDGWVYVTDEDAFYLLDSEELVSMQSFNAKFNRFLPPAEDGEFRRSAAWVALEDARIPTVTRRVYLPWADKTFELDGLACANLFRRSSMPETASAMTDAGREAQSLVLRHLDLLCSGRKEVVQTLVDWMAHNVQHPGKKIRWAPLIKGIPGDGKSLIGDIMRSVMGLSNVRAIAPVLLGTNFTDWAHGACVGVLEELKVTGHNRYEIENALKPFITNRYVDIHPKGGKPYNVINTMNYAAFTNYPDALPLNDTDRRWFVIFSPFLSRADLLKALGDVDAYFDSLFAAIEEHREELRKWLIDHRISETFKPNGVAPMTAEKGSMIALGVSPEEDAVATAIQTGAVGIGQSVVLVSRLKEVINQGQGDLLMNEKEIAVILTRNGWLKAPKQIKWKGEPIRPWVRGLDPTDSFRIREMLDETLVNVQKDADKEDLFANDSAGAS